jgi:hypothetical protein
MLFRRGVMARSTVRSRLAWACTLGEGAPDMNTDRRDAAHATRITRRALAVDLVCGYGMVASSIRWGLVVDDDADARAVHGAAPERIGNRPANRDDLGGHRR